MLTFKQLREKIAITPKGQTPVKAMKIMNTDVLITKDGSDFNLFVDGEEIDSYNSAKAAENGARDFIRLHTK